MRYIVYIDKLLILVFLFHMLQLVIAKRFFLCTATRRRVFTSALVGTCLFYVLFGLISGTILYRISLGSLISSLVIIPICFGQRSKTKCIKLYAVSASAVFVILSCLACTIGQSNYVLLGMTLIPTFICAFLVTNHRVVYREKGREDQQSLVRVSLPGKEKLITVLALLDSGNSLYEPFSSRPVHLIDRQLAKELDETFCHNSYRVVPYQSVGCKRGYLDSYRIPFIIIHLELEDRKIYDPVLAIAKQGLGDNSRYRMILHPDLFIRRSDNVVESGRERKRLRAIHWSK